MKSKMLDPKNVTMRANRMMTSHIKMFEDHFGEYEKIESNYFFGDDAEWVSVSYVTDSKLMTKIFSTHVNMVLSDIDMPETWQARSQLLGGLKVQGLVFREARKQSSQIVKNINENERLMSRLFNEIKELDIQNITLKYNKDIREMTVEINPYAGSFIWVKLPPLYYDVRLKAEEIEKMYNILEIFKEFFLQNYRTDFAKIN